jgi:hypothetical protein
MRMTRRHLRGLDRELGDERDGVTRRGRRGQGNGHAGELVQCLRRNRTTSTMITMITMNPKLMNMGYSSRYLRVSQR